VSELRPISSADYAKVITPDTFGRPPKLDWIAIKHLVVDPEYQREITGKGRMNVRRIALQFNWSMFAPVVVAAAGCGKFAIVDGQHRTTAALICGVDKVPCAIIEARRGEQAAAFRAINGNVTQLNLMQLHHAAIAAGDAKAKLIETVCAKADCVILRYPKDHTKIQPGETMAVKVVGRVIAAFGEDCVVTTLKAIRESGDGNPGMLRGPIIFGSCEVLHDHPEWMKSGGGTLRCIRRNRSSRHAARGQRCGGAASRLIHHRSIRGAARDCARGSF
jgi:hypothetical protein